MILTLNEVKHYNDDIIIYSDVALDPSGISYGNFDLQLIDSDADGITFTPITIGESEVSVIGNNIHITTPIQPRKNYVLTLYSIYDATGSEMVGTQTFKFLVSGYESLPSINNVYKKLNDLNNLLSIEYVVKNEDDYKIDFAPSNYNFDTKSYESAEESIRIDNDATIIERLVYQYFNEYKTFYDIINTRATTTPTDLMYDQDYIKELHLLFMDNIAKWYSLKGNTSTIELLFALYTRYFGEVTISIIEDPVQTFMYRVSSSLPRKIWESQVKPFVHPLSWVAVYNEITSDTRAVNWEIINMKQLMRQRWILDSISHLDANYYSKRYYAHYKKLALLAHTAGGISPDNSDTHKFGKHKDCTFTSKYDSVKFNYNFGGVTIPEYPNTDQNNIDTELRDLSNIRFNIDRFNKTVTLDFGMPGVADLYLYEVYNNNILVHIQESLLSSTTCPIETDDVVVLKLKKNKWTKSVYRMDQSAFIPYKDLHFSAVDNSVFGKYINVRNNNKEAYQYNGLTLQSFNSQKTNTSWAATNDLDYNFASPSLITTFVTEFDTNITYGITYTSTTDSLGTPYKIATFTYPKTGIATKYVWDLYINNTLVNSNTTTLNTTNFSIRTSDYNNAKVKLTIFYKNGSYSLNKAAICTL
jgi:hypothetical protein